MIMATRFKTARFDDAEDVLAIDGLCINLGTAGRPRRVLDEVSLRIRRGETACLVGESGSGKSLTSLAIMGLLPADVLRVTAGTIRLDGTEILTRSRRQLRAMRGDRMAMIFQEPMTALNPVFTIGNQIIDVLRRHKGLTRKQARSRAIDMLAEVGIPAPDKRVDEYPHQLSGGMRQRVMIAMALMCEPELIIADEPTTALDVTIQAQILRLLADLQREMNMAMILVTHDLGVVARIADKVVVMYAGEVVDNGSAREIFENPRHPYTRGLLRCIPVPGKTKPGEHLGSIPGIVPSLIGKVEGCAFRSRCEVAEDACSSPVPVRRPGTDHAYRCIHDIPEGASA